MTRETTIQSACTRACLAVDRKLCAAIKELRHSEKETMEQAQETTRRLQSTELELQRLREELLDRADDLSMRLAAEETDDASDSDMGEEPEWSPWNGSSEDGEISSWGEAPSSDFPYAEDVTATLDGSSEWTAQGVVSSYNGNGTFENCFHLRSMTKARSVAAFRLPPVSKNYLSQLEPRLGQTVTATGTLVGSVRYDNCIRLVLDGVVLAKGQGMKEPMGPICLFVSRDYRVPEKGTRLEVTGIVYAYSPSQPGRLRRQLGIDAITLQTLGK